MNGKLKDLTINRDESQNITITVTSDFREMFDKLKDETVSIEIKKASSRRSMDANAYLWYLCGEIAKESSRFSDDGKNDVYREAIKKKGEFVSLVVKEYAVDMFISRWAEKGTGWFAEVVDDYIDDADEYGDIMGERERSKVIHAYYGSSTYDSKSMSHIIDYVVNMANDLGIVTMTDNELNKILQSWQKKKEKHAEVDSTT